MFRVSALNCMAQETTSHSDQAAVQLAPNQPSRCLRSTWGVFGAASSCLLSLRRRAHGPCLRCHIPGGAQFFPGLLPRTASASRAAKPVVVGRPCGGASSVTFGLRFVNLARFSRRLAGKSKTAIARFGTQPRTDARNRLLTVQFTTLFILWRNANGDVDLWNSNGNGGIHRSGSRNCQQQLANRGHGRLQRRRPR